MRVDPQGYAEINEKTNRNPRFVVHIDFGGTPETELWVTSHNDTRVAPDTAVADIQYNALKNISGTSQKLDPIKALSTIGTMSFDVIDKDNNLSNRLHTEHGTGVVTEAHRGLRGKTVRFYVGEEGLEWDNYILIQTQIIQGVSLDKGTYGFKTADVQRTARKIIFDAKQTTLLNSVNSTQTTIEVDNASGFEMLQHGSSYTSQQNNKVGYFGIKDEIIAYAGVSNIAIAVSGTDVSFAGDTISSTSIDFTQFQVGMNITIAGSPANSGTYQVHATVAPTANALRVTGSFTTEGPGPQISVSAAAQFMQCTRGELATKAVSHTMSDPLPQDISRRFKVTEVVYLEMPVVKLAYAILTGSLYGTADVMPSGWHLNISTDFVSTTEFINIGPDHWDLTDDSLGLTCRFISAKKTSGKRFIEQELLLMGGLFMPVLSDGQLGLRRMTRILTNAAYVEVLDESNVMSISPLKHDLEALYNQFSVNWNWEPAQKKFTRSSLLIDGDSITRHGATDPYVMNFQGLHGSTSSEAALVLQVNSARDRYAGPPEVITVNCLFALNIIEVGDIVKLKLENLQDFVDGGSRDRSFEVQSVKTNWRTGEVTLSLFGSSMDASLTSTVEGIGASLGGKALDDAYYTSAGTDISTVTNGQPIGNLWRITSNSTITGDTNLNASGSIFYYDGDVEIAAGVTLFVQNNVQLRVNGDLTVNGVVEGSERGLAAPARSNYSTGTPVKLSAFNNPTHITNWQRTPAGGVAGGIGNTRADGSITRRFILRHVYSSFFGGLITVNDSVTSYASALTRGKEAELPYYPLRNNGTSLAGLPNDLRGSSGGNGGWACMYDLLYEDAAAGQKGGAGGAGLCVIAENLYKGASAAIRLNGGDGTKGGDTPSYLMQTPTVPPAFNTGISKVHAGSGAGGAAGGFLVIIDGVGGEAATSMVQQIHGKTPSTGYTPAESRVLPTYEPVDNSINTKTRPRPDRESYYVGIGYTGINQSATYTRVQKLAEIVEAEIDQPDETDGTGATTPGTASIITLQESGPAATTLNQTSIEVAVSAPTGTGPYVDNYQSSHVYARNTANTDESWFDVGTVGPIGELAFGVEAIGSTWIVKAHAVSVTGVESNDFITETITVTNALATVIGVGNEIVTTVSPETGGGISISEDGIIAYDNTGDALVRIDSTTGTITAMEATLVGGGITLNSGGSIKSTGLTNENVDATAGVWLGWNGTDYTFGAGNGGDQYIKYDGDTLEIGPETKVLGVDSINSDTIYYHSWLDSTDEFNKSSAVGTVTRPLHNLGLRLAGQGTDIDAWIERSRDAIGVTPTWGKKRTMRCGIRWESHSDMNTITPSFMGMGYTNTSFASVGFDFIRSSSTIYVYPRSRSVIGGGTHAYGAGASSMFTFGTGQTDLRLRADVIPGVSVKYYINDVLRRTVTGSAVPRSGDSAANRFCTCKVQGMTAVGVVYCYINEWTFYQDET